MSEIDYEKQEGTWSYELSQHWKAFSDICDLMNEKGNEGKVDKLKWREYVLWDMQRRHDKECKAVLLKRKNG